MKKLLIPLLCSLVAAWSCSMESSYYAENAQDIVTVTENKLINDNGTVYTIAEKAATGLPELEQDKRYYIVFDILNQQFEIRLTQAILVEMVSAPELPEETEGLGNDPIMFQFTQLTRSHLDLGISYYYAPNSNYAHQIKFYSTLENAGSQMNIHIFHDGNNENPAAMEDKDLKIKGQVFSIPVSGWNNVSEVNIVCDVLTKDSATGQYTVTRRSYELQ